MEPRTILPIDILISIIELLASGDDGDLQILSQTCKFMVPLCRKHLFSALYLHDRWEAKRFSELLSKNPDVARYVKSLDYGVYKPIRDYDLNLLDILQEHSTLQSIKLRSVYKWMDIPESIRGSLVFLIQMPTVTHLTLESFTGFPATALSRCSNLIDLQLGDWIKFGSPEDTPVISRSKIPTPVSLNVMRKGYDGLAALLNPAILHTCGPIVDFSGLQKAFFTFDSPSDIGQLNELIKVTPRLRNFYITMRLPIGLAGLGASLAINAYRTLTLLGLIISIGPGGDTIDPLCGLSRELRFIAGNNVLEELELDVLVSPDASCRTEPDDWFPFDTVLTESGAFPMLRRVFVEICWDSYGMAKEDEDRVLEGLKQIKFPRLVESKAVEFKFEADIHYVTW